MTKEIVYEKISSMILAAACCLSIARMTSSCKTEEVTLSVWCAHDDIALTEQLIEDFKNEYSGKAVFNITISEEEELSCKETVLANPSAAADEIIAANGGKDSGAIRCDDFSHKWVNANNMFAVINKSNFVQFIYGVHISNTRQLSTL